MTVSKKESESSASGTADTLRPVSTGRNATVRRQSGKDKVIEKTAWQKYRKPLSGGAIALFGLMAFWVLNPAAGRALKVQNDRIVISTVSRGEFDDFIPVPAPVAGKLTAFDLEVGQALSRGINIGQIDDPESLKLTANIYEFYISRVDLEQTGALSTAGKDYRLSVRKIYPQVQNGEEVMDLLIQLNQQGTTILMVTHPPAHAEFARRDISLFDGEVMSESLRKSSHLLYGIHQPDRQV
jgi:hypothetical protein